AIVTDLDQPSVATDATEPPPAEPTDPPRPARRGRSRWWSVVAVVILGAALGTGVAKWDSSDAPKNTSVGATINALGDDPSVAAGLVGNAHGSATTVAPPPIHT